MSSKGVLNGIEDPLGNLGQLRKVCAKPPKKNDPILGSDQMEEKKGQKCLAFVIFPLKGVK